MKGIKTKNRGASADFPIASQIFPQQRRNAQVVWPPSPRKHQSQVFLLLGHQLHLQWQVPPVQQVAQALQVLLHLGNGKLLLQHHHLQQLQQLP